jgi:putative flippase GtrA
MGSAVGRSAFRQIAGELVRFGVITSLSAIVSLGLPVVLHEFLQVSPKVAVGISQASVLLMNFLTLRFFVFRSSGGVRAEMVRYAASAVAFRGLEYLSFLALFELAGMFYVTALVITLATSTIIKFVWYRFLFGRRSAFA